MSKHIWCVDSNTARTAGDSSRFYRVYLTQEEKDKLDRMKTKPKGVAYLVQPGTIQERERDELEKSLKNKTMLS